jgi:hypothetical protein
MATQATVTKHGRDYFLRRCLAWEFAKKSMFRDKDGQVRTYAEDLFHGCFDAIGVMPSGRLLLVQWTSDNSGAVSYRRRKIEERYMARFVAATTVGTPAWAELKARLMGHQSVELWAYIARTGFQIYRFDFDRWVWAKPLLEALPKRPRPSKTGRQALAQGGTEWQLPTT